MGLQNVLAPVAGAPGATATLIDETGSPVAVQVVAVPSATPNVVSFTNSAALPAASPLVVTSPPITRKGSGQFEVSASACPIPTAGGGLVITFGLTRDYGTASAVQLGTSGTPIARKIVPAGAGQDAEGAITPFVDVVTDFLPHTYSIVMTTTTTLSEGAGHVVLMVKEL